MFILSIFGGDRKAKSLSKAYRTGHRGVKWEDFISCIAKTKMLHAAFVLLNVSIVDIQGVDKGPQPNGAGSF